MTNVQIQVSRNVVVNYIQINIPENKNQKNNAHANNVTTEIDIYIMLYNTHRLRSVHTLVQIDDEDIHHHSIDVLTMRH